MYSDEEIEKALIYANYKCNTRMHDGIPELEGYDKLKIKDSLLDLKNNNE